jgi:colanic acid biosynthesis glycosyl transferase WcaI
MRVLLVNQVFPPDVAATAQYAGDLAREMAAGGHEVTVVAARRAYDQPNVRFPAREDWHSVRIVRVRSTGFGKDAAWRRVVDFLTFLASAAARLATLGRFDAVVVMTTPPLLPVLGALYTMLRGGQLTVWVMDLNPDEAVAAGWLREGSVIERVLSGLSRWSLRRADQVIVLDRFMRERVLGKGVSAEKVSVVPPWSHDPHVRYDPEGREEFRRRHGLEGKFVVMYSGNHSPCHPLDTLLEAAEKLGDGGTGGRGDCPKEEGPLPDGRGSVREPEIVFCFVGGGSEFGKVKAFAEQRGLRNIICLPYQPLEELSASLSAADLHVVVMGDAFVGIVHPCKIYNILRLGIPFLYIGPAESHVTELAEGIFARHGEVDKVVGAIAGAAAGQDGRRDKTGVLSHQGFDVHAELFSGIVLGQRNVVAGLQIHPVLGRGAEEQSQPQSGVGSD